VLWEHVIVSPPFWRPNESARCETNLQGRSGSGLAITLSSGRASSDLLRTRTYDPSVAVEREPAPALRSYVRRYYGFRETTAAPVRRVEGPGVDVVVLLSFGFDWLIGDATSPSRPWERCTSFVAGLREGAVLTEHDGRSYGMQISLTPPGAFALLGMPMHELVGRTVALDDVLGKHADRLTERLADLDDWGERFELLDSTLASRLGDARPPSRRGSGRRWACRRNRSLGSFASRGRRLSWRAGTGPAWRGLRASAAITTRLISATSSGASPA
jgi:hypothetical protein